MSIATDLHIQTLTAEKNNLTKQILDNSRAYRAGDEFASIENVALSTELKAINAELKSLKSAKKSNKTKALDLIG